MIIVLSIFIFIFTIAGSTAGLGGGMILKPLIDFTGMYAITAVNFISGTITLFMSLSNAVTKKIIEPQKPVFTGEMKIIAIGSALGGTAGKILFSLMTEGTGDKMCSVLQSSVLLIINVLILYFTVKGIRVSYRIKNKAAVFLIGSSIGTLSSFLGIGGGPLNIITLKTMLGLDVKKTADYSLCMILFTQGASAVISAVSGETNVIMLKEIVIYMVAGIAGGISGRVISQRISEKTVNTIYICLLVIIMAIIVLTMFTYFI